MIAALLLVSVALHAASAEQWRETFVMESISVEGQPIDVTSVEATGSPVMHCIPRSDVNDMTGWLRSRDSKRCSVTTKTIGKDRLRLEASCSSETEAASRKVIDVTIGRHSYSGTYVESGRNPDGKPYRLLGRFMGHRAGKCVGSARGIKRRNSEDGNANTG